MKILVYLTFRESQDHYIMITNKPKLYKQTKTLPVIMIVFKPVWQMKDVENGSWKPVR